MPWTMPLLPSLSRWLLAVAACCATSGCSLPPEPLRTPPSPDALQHGEATIAAWQPRRARPTVAVLAHPEGTETTDFLVPHALLQRSGVATVHAVAPRAGRIPLMPALEVEVDWDLARFDAQYPEGADYVIVPALHRSDDPAVLRWLQKQHRQGATVLAICAGSLVLAQAGLLDGRGYTGHWWDRETLRRQARQAHFVPDRRLWMDQGVGTTTGVSASLPATLALIDAIAPGMGAHMAREAGLAGWSLGHASAAFALGPGDIWAVVRNSALWWRHTSIPIAVEDGMDDAALALVADAWSRTYQSQAEAVAARAGPVRLASGLPLYARTDAAEYLRAAPMPASRHARQPAACALARSLSAIAAHQGERTAGWVAKQLEYLPPQEAAALQCSGFEE